MQFSLRTRGPVGLTRIASVLRIKACDSGDQVVLQSMILHGESSNIAWRAQVRDTYLPFHLERKRTENSFFSKVDAKICCSIM